MPWSLISTRNETVRIARGGWLDALRFIVAFLIILHHFQAAGPEPLAHLINPIFERGGFLLTNFFLIDSGYVLMRVYGAAVDKGRMSPGDFFLKRFLRVVPAHLIMGLSMVGFVLLATSAGAPPRNPEWFAWDQLPAQLLLLLAKTQELEASGVLALAQVVGHRRAVGLVVRVEVVAEGLAGRVDHEGDVLGPLLQRGAQHVDHAEQRAGRLAQRVGQRRQRVEGAIQVGGSIDQHELLHARILGGPGQAPAAGSAARCLVPPWPAVDSGRRRHRHTLDSGMP